MADLYDRLKAEDLRQRELMDNMAFDKYPLKTFNYIGQSGVRRVDGFEKASGYAEYTADINLAGMLWGRFLTAPYPHATITSYDISKAAALPGVRSILKYDDPDCRKDKNLSGRTGGVPATPHALLSATTHFEGEPMGFCVAADTEDIAEDAIKLIAASLKWNVLPFAIETNQAKSLGTDVNLEWYPTSKGNLFRDTTVAANVGDVTAGFAAADKTIEWDGEQRMSIGFGPERFAGACRWNGEYPEIWQKGQRPIAAKFLVSQYFEIPMDKVECHSPYQGGSFGGFTQMAWQNGPLICACVLSKRTGSPVKCVGTRREEFYYGNVDVATTHYKVGFKNDGTITAVDMSTQKQMENMAYTQHLVQSTKIPNVHETNIAFVTNIPVPTATRCEQNGNCNAIALVNAHVAEAVGKDPCTIASLNDGAYGHDITWLTQQKTALGFNSRDSLAECIAAGKKAMNWDALWHLPGTKTLPNGRMHGLGMYETRGWDDSGGIGNGAIRIEENEGTATLLSLRCDCGTNEETGYCQVVADELGFNITDVSYRCFKDPGFRTFSPDTSTNTSLGAYVFRNAARTLKVNILDRATRDFVTQWHTLYKAAFPGKTPEQLAIKNSVIYEIANPSNSMTMKAFTQYVEGSPEPMFASGWQSQNGTYSEIRQHFVRQAHFMEVEVDTETGQVFVTNMASCNDVGKVVSPEGAADQCYGGSTMGTSRSLMEEVIWDPQTGACLNSNGYDYKLLTLLDCPPITPIILETGQGYGPYGISGLGESNGSIECMTALAVNNAIGKWVDRPTTPERVLKALGKA